jgi:hypothetical protein
MTDSEYFKCVPTKFQRGDIVLTPTGRRDMVTAVGMKRGTPVFRVGRCTYWHAWQLKLQGNGGKTE